MDGKTRRSEGCLRVLILDADSLSPIGKEADKMSKIVIISFRSVKGEAAMGSSDKYAGGAEKNIQKDK
jgi:hypothetical protein